MENVLTKLAAWTVTRKTGTNQHNFNSDALIKSNGFLSACRKDTLKRINEKYLESVNKFDQTGNLLPFLLTYYSKVFEMLVNK